MSEGQMPLRSYTLMHRDVRLTDEERELLLKWMRAEPPRVRGKSDQGR
ncbi:MAG: heme-binding domain-containing protein [Gemmatimonadota bacterium]|nr:MAG: heme-binding domain-containing protein [Gemmatimonadota bacterium]